MDKKYVFPKVDLKNQPKTNFDLSHTVRTTFAPCLSIPIMDIETLPGDSFVTKMQSLIESLPMVAPALGRWKARFKFFINPMSNLYRWMDNNERLSTEDWLNRACHKFVLPFPDWISTGASSVQDQNVPIPVQSSCLFQYLGLPLGFMGVFWEPGSEDLVLDYDGNRFNAEGLLTYFDIVRNYCVNNQEDSFPMIVSQSNESRGYIANTPTVKYYSLTVLDAWFAILRQQFDGVSNVFDLGDYDFLGYDGDVISELSTFLEDLSYSYTVPLGGLVCTPYLMDFNRGIMNARVGNLESKVFIDEDTNSFGIPQLQFKNKMQNLVNLLDLSGGRFGDVLSVVWQSNLKGGVDKPIFLGSRSEWIYMQDIISTATTGAVTDAESSTLGQQGGFVAGRTRHENRAVCNFKFNEYGRFMCIFELIPDVDYSAGIDLKLYKTSFSDKYMPQYAQIGYQDVSNHELSALPARQVVLDNGDGTNVVVNVPDEQDNGVPYKVGKRIAWSEYMTHIDKVYGEFAQGGKFDYWALLRRYRYSQSFHNPDIGIGVGASFDIDYTTYAMPFLFNYLFVEQDLTAQNFRLQVYFNIKAKRPFPKRSMPRL